MENQPVSEMEYLQLRAEFMKAVEKRSNVRTGEVQLDYYSGDITPRPGSTKRAFESRIDLNTEGGIDASGGVLYHPVTHTLVTREKLYTRTRRTLTLSEEHVYHCDEHIEVRREEVSILIDALLTRDDYDFCLQVALQAQHPIRDFDFRYARFQEQARKAYAAADSKH